jgi:hypothetical protein
MEDMMKFVLAIATAILLMVTPALAKKAKPPPAQHPTVSKQRAPSPPLIGRPPGSLPFFYNRT